MKRSDRGCELTNDGQRDHELTFLHVAGRDIILGADLCRATIRSRGGYRRY